MFSLTGPGALMSTWIRLDIGAEHFKAVVNKGKVVDTDNKTSVLAFSMSGVNISCYIYKIHSRVPKSRFESGGW